MYRLRARAYNGCMIELFWGNDTVKKRSALEKELDSVVGGKPHSQIFEYDASNCTAGTLDEALYSQSLFGDTISIFYDILLDEKYEQQVKEVLRSLTASPHYFFFVENTLPQKLVDSFKKHGAKVFSFEEKEAKKSAFPIFSITDSVGARDKKRAWIVLQEALAAGIAAEHIHGLLHWQFKNMNIVKNNIQNTGLSLFVLTKTKRAVLLYSEKELRVLSSQLVSLYHDAHRGGMPLDLALEKFVLTL